MAAAFAAVDRSGTPAHRGGGNGSNRLSETFPNKKKRERESLRKPVAVVAALVAVVVAIARLVVGPNRGVVLFVGDGGNSAAQVSGTPVRQP